jgi:D-3-phosphoglycerate dehydrogenase
MSHRTNQPQKVVITDYGFENTDLERDVLEPLGYKLTTLKAGKDRALIDLVWDADAVITQFATVNAEVIEAMEKCRGIVRYGIGVDNVDIAAAAAKGIPVCNVPDYCIDEVADHTLALLLALTRRVVPNHKSVSGGGWGLAGAVDSLKSLKYLTVGLVAFGRIGREVAARLAPFKCRILVFDPAVSPEVLRQAGVEPTGFDDLLAASDVITLHCPTTPKTRGMINAAVFEKMKQGTLLVNASRGELVVTDDLLAALHSGRIAGAALDVTSPEPLPPDHPLRTAENVVISPHVAAYSLKAIHNLRSTAAGIAASVLRGEIPPNIVNGVVL